METFFILGFVWLGMLVLGICLLAVRLYALDQVCMKFEAGAEELVRRPAQWWMVGLVIAGGVFLLGVGGLVQWLLGLEAMDGELLPVIIQNMVGYVVFLCILVFIHRQVDGGLRALFVGADPTPVSAKLGQGVIYFIMASPLIFGLSYLYFEVCVVLGIPLEQQPIMEMLGRVDQVWIMVLMGVFAVVMAPVMEELLFRGVVLPLLARRVGLWGGIFLTSLGFAFLHGHLQTLFPLLVVATFFSIGYVFGRNIWVPIAMHGCFNGFNLLVAYISRGLV